MDHSKQEIMNQRNALTRASHVSAHVKAHMEKILEAGWERYTIILNGLTIQEQLALGSPFLFLQRYPRVNCAPTGVQAVGALKKHESSILKYCTIFDPQNDSKHQSEPNSRKKKAKIDKKHLLHRHIERVVSPTLKT